MPHDAVYVVRPGPNPELRWSLRSLAANVPHARVWIAGHMPEWVTGVEHLPTRQTPCSTTSGDGRRDNAWANLCAAVECGDITETFDYWNDDMYALEPCRSVPVVHGGPLIDQVLTYEKRHPTSGYTALLRATHDYLGGGLTYDLHFPMTLNRAALREIMGTLNPLTPRPLWRTVYGNAHHLGGAQVEDPKVYPWQRTPRALGAWLSTCDNSLFMVKAALRRRFPDPCRYER